MDMSEGKWVSLDKFALKKGMSKGTAYRLINRGELIKRFIEGEIEVFVAGEEAGLFDNIESSSRKGDEIMDFDIELPPGDEYGIAAKSLHTLMSMHKEVLAEKHRMLAEWETELAKREERLGELKTELAEKNAKLDEKIIENNELGKALKKARETSERFERDIEETRNSLLQIREMSDSSQQDWDRLNRLLEDKDKIIEAKNEIISGMESAVGQNEMAVKESERIIEEYKRSLEKARELLKEKEHIIQTIENEPADLDGKLAARDKKIAELSSLVDFLEKQLASNEKSKELTGFEQDTEKVTSLIQDQLEYLMTDQSNKEPETGEND